MSKPMAVPEASFGHSHGLASPWAYNFNRAPQSSQYFLTIALEAVNICILTSATKCGRGEWIVVVKITSDFNQLFKGTGHV